MRQRSASSLKGVPKAPSAIEEALALQLRIEQIPDPVREFKFCPNRRWRADFAWVYPIRLLVECEGGIWSGGRHVASSGFLNDMEKYNHATMLGYRLLRFDMNWIRSGKAVEMIKTLLSQEE